MRPNPDTFFIVPGYRMQADEPAFAWMRGFLRREKFRVVCVPVIWKRRTLSQQSSDFLAFYREKQGVAQNLVLGFSAGATIAFATAPLLRPDALFLCSLGPDFAEDAHTVSAHVLRVLGKRRVDDMATRSAVAIARRIDMPCAVIYGQAEAAQFPSLKHRSDETARLVRGATRWIAAEAPHQIDHVGYVETVKKAVLQWRKNRR